MNYKVKSLIYLFAFILCAVLYHQMDEHPEDSAENQLPEISMQHQVEDTPGNPAL